MSEVRAAARRSYPVAEASISPEETPHVRGQGSDREELSRVRQRSGAAGRRHPVSEARGGDPEEAP